jgi:ubiquinone/menaquinone biosynthesis C-methylase UbiE
MKMTDLEKRFVNSPSHSRQVGLHAEKMLQFVDFRAGQRYLDVGCGNGAAPIRLAQKYQLEVTGIDVDPDQIKLAQAHSQSLVKARFLTVSGTQMPFEDGEFDLVATNKVMHHIRNWEDAVREMCRVLKPDGFFIYADFVYPGWLAAAGRLLVGNRAGFPTRRLLEAVFERYGLVVVHRSTSVVNYEAVLRKK